jgi:23S rRNA (cytosine1962-C5)-methyltransferase
MEHRTYSLLDFGGGERLEQWGPYRLRRPDPVAQGLRLKPELWQSADAAYEGEKGKGLWVQRTPLPAQWELQFDDLRMIAKLTPYKHTGIFPEQQENWQWARGCAQRNSIPLTVLNLFAYTGGATMALAKDGHFVTHVDASKPAITWAKENAELNSIAHDGVRWMWEDVPTFVSNEVRRGKRYDAIILDPPAYGHGSTGKTWRVERDLAPLLEKCCALLSDEPSFLLLNGYAHADTPESFRRLLSGIFLSAKRQKKFTIETKELLLPVQDGRTLSTGIVARCNIR